IGRRVTTRGPTAAGGRLARRAGGRSFLFVLVAFAGRGEAVPLAAAELHPHGLVAPDFLEVVVLAQGRLQDVHDRVAAVDQHPFAGVFTLGADDVAAGFLDLVTHARREGLGLAVGGARSDDHAVEQF